MELAWSLSKPEVHHLKTGFHQLVRRGSEKCNACSQNLGISEHPQLWLHTFELLMMIFCPENPGWSSEFYLAPGSRFEGATQPEDVIHLDSPRLASVVS